MILVVTLTVGKKKDKWLKVKEPRRSVTLPDKDSLKYWITSRGDFNALCFVRLRAWSAQRRSVRGGEVMMYGGL